MLSKIRAFVIVVVGVFICSAGPIFISNGLNIFEFPLSTWEIIVSAGCFGVVGYLMVFFARNPFLQPSGRARFPEA